MRNSRSQQTPSPSTPTLVEKLRPKAAQRLRVTERSVDALVRSPLQGTSFYYHAIRTRGGHYQGTRTSNQQRSVGSPARSATELRISSCLSACADLLVSSDKRPRQVMVARPCHCSSLTPTALGPHSTRGPIATHNAPVHTLEACRCRRQSVPRRRHGPASKILHTKRNRSHQEILHSLVTDSRRKPDLGYSGSVPRPLSSGEVCMSRPVVPRQSWRCQSER